MEGKTKGKKKMKGKDFRAKDDMEKVLSDSRFSHLPFDAKLRHLPKEERKVKIDSRFSSMFSDDKFYEKATMDPRGRKGNYSTKENLKKFYDLPSDESDEEEEEEEEKEEKEEEKPLENTEIKERKKLDETVTPEDETDDEIKHKEVPEDISDRLQDMSQDYARGAAIFSDDSSDGDSSSDEDEGQVFEWGELDQDAVWDTQQEVEETSRFAVCNLDWNHIKAVDIMVIFHSFCPSGGSVYKVTIYPSEFGKERIAEEEHSGPMELLKSSNQTSKKFNENDVDLDKLEKGKLNYRTEESKFENLRRYERNRLRYYYAVVECDSVDTAKVLYKDCDGHSFESAGVYMDMRYIPNDMAFDETPHDVCDTVPEFYENKTFVTTALFDSQPTLTWDQTDPHRQKVLSNAMNSALTGQVYNEEYLKNYIASSSEEESDPAEEGDYSSDEGEGAKNARISNFRALIQEIDEKEKKKGAGRFDMETVFGVEGKEGSEDENSSSEDDSDEKDLNPFEKYLEKRRNKMKEKREKKLKAQNEDNSSDEEDNRSVEGLRNDPFFAEELEKRQKQENKLKKKKKKAPKKEEDEDEDQGDLELLLMDEDQEDKKHFSMRDIIDEHKGKSKKKLKKLRGKQKLEEKLKAKKKDVEDFKVDTVDPRFSHLLTSGDYNIDPSHPQFKRTKAVDSLIGDIQKKRIAESFENMPEPKRVNTAKGKEELELSMLVKRVKNKSKKPK